jgi:hypothetical protein
VKGKGTIPEFTWRYGEVSRKCFIRIDSLQIETKPLICYIIAGVLIIQLQHVVMYVGIFMSVAIDLYVTNISALIFTWTENIPDTYEQFRSQ